MGLAESQRLLARLSTDAPLRARFRSDPVAVAGDFGLTTDEVRTLAALPVEQLDDFAASLIGKRRGEVESLLPLCVRVVGPARFAALFRRHASAYVPTGIKRHRDDAVAFASLLALESEPPWLPDIARLEAASLKAHDPSRRWTALLVRHHPADLARAALEGEAPRRRPTLIAWFRPGRRRKLRRVIVARPW